MTYCVRKHVRIVSDQPENMHFVSLFCAVQSQQAIGLRTLVHRPRDYRQTVAAADHRGIDLSESGLLIAGTADEATGSVTQRLGDALRVLEDIGGGERTAADAVEGPECKRVEAGDQDTLPEAEIIYQGNDLAGKCGVYVPGFHL